MSNGAVAAATLQHSRLPAPSSNRPHNGRLVPSKSLPAIKDLHSRILAPPRPPLQKQKLKRRRESFIDLTPLRDRMVSTNILSESLKSECLERLDRVTEQVAACSVLPKLDVCPAWTRCDRDHGVTGESQSELPDGGGEGGLAVLRHSRSQSSSAPQSHRCSWGEATLGECKEPPSAAAMLGQLPRFGPQAGGAEREREREREACERQQLLQPRAAAQKPHSAAAAPRQPQPQPQPQARAAEAPGAPRPARGGSPGPLGRSPRRMTWAAPEHRLGWDLFWIEGWAGDCERRSASPVERAASRARAPGAAAAAAAAAAAGAAQRMPLPVLLSRSEAALAMRCLAGSCGDAPAAGERGAAMAGLRFRSLEKNTLRSVTRS